MKRVISGLLLLFVMIIMSACSGNEDTYDFDELQMTLTNTSGEEIQLFVGNEKELYVYFTGVY